MVAVLLGVCSVGDARCVEVGGESGVKEEEKERFELLCCPK
jgi:hypothetical protein